MKRKKDWKKELRKLNIDFEITDGKIVLWPQYHFGLREYVTVQEIWRLIKGYKKNYWKKDLKHYDHRINRVATKQKMDNQDYDTMFHDKQVYYEDPWSWT